MRYLCNPPTEGASCDDINCRVNEVCEIDPGSEQAICVTQFSIGDCDPTLPDACAEGRACLPGLRHARMYGWL